MSGKANDPILVCFAVKEEAAPFRRDLPVGVETVVTGMGAAAAERAVRAKLAERTWSLVLTCGFAGGLHPALRPETVIFEADADFPLRQALLEVGAVAVSFHCAERVAVTAVEKTALRERTRADAVEMESGIIRRLCRERGIPSATVRTVSDAAHEELPLDFNTLMQANGAIHLGKLAGAILCRPHKIPAMIALGSRSKSAAERLAAVLRVVLAR
jgi:adenosylhomocysteine nucleosidase